jgi:sulfatase maturation enzyme AslB (radical SAM superfamily)
MNSFCVLPFFSVEIGQDSLKNTYCCRLANNTNIDDVRAAIKNGERSSACKTCWDLEDRGLTSERQIHNRTFDFYADRNIEDVEAAAIAGNYSPQIIKLSTSNLCNSTCVTCNSTLSSAWAALKNNKVQYQLIPDNYLDNIDWGNIVQLSFVGGEPLLEKKNFAILSKLIETNNTKCFISIVTNGSVTISDSQLETLSKFANLNVCVSIDGVGKSFEYLRYPLKWNDLTKNLAMFKKIAKYVSVSCMISNLNIFYYTDMIEFFKSENIDYTCKQITNPKHFAPGNLPPHIKNHVLANNSKYHNEVESFLSMGTYSTKLFDVAINEINHQDLLKNISIKDYLAEVNFE